MTPTETQAALTEAQRLAELKWLADEAKSLVFNAGQPCEYEHIRMPRIQAAWDVINRLYCLATPSPVPPAEEPAAVQSIIARLKAFRGPYIGDGVNPGIHRDELLSALASSAPGTVVGEDTERLDWLEKTNPPITRGLDGLGDRLWWVGTDFAIKGSTLRAAIDAARAQASTGEQK